SADALSRPGARSPVIGCRSAGPVRGAAGGLAGAAFGGAGFGAEFGGTARDGAGDGLRLRNGLTSRSAARHSSESAAFAIGGLALDENDMQAARPVRAELDTLLDIAGARRASDEIDGAWHGAALAQPGPAFLVGRQHLIGAQHDDMRVGQEVERRRRLGTGG